MKKTKMLKKNYEFKNVLSKGRYYSGKYIEAFIQKTNQSKQENLLGIAISSKIAKAVQRNHIKRLVRESYQNYEEYLKEGNRMVFLWKKKVEVEKATFYHIKKDMKNIFDKANLIKE